MKMSEVCARARALGLKNLPRKKRDLIHTIQRAEGNRDCYDRGESRTCGQDGCAWRNDCK